MAIHRHVVYLGFLGLISCMVSEKPRSDAKIIIGENNLHESVEASPEYREFGRSVARVINDTSCSAIRLTTDIFITNHHCIHNSMAFQLGWEVGADSSSYLVYEYSKEFFRTKGELLLRNHKLDYAIFKAVRRSTYSDDRLADFPPATLAKERVDELEPLISVSHPEGMRQKIDESSECKVAKVSDPWFSHHCDTNPGSSGSAIFDRKSGRVVGLHFWGDRTVPENRAMRMELIVKDIGEKMPELLSNFDVR